MAANWLEYVDGPNFDFSRAIQIMDGMAVIRPARPMACPGTTIGRAQESDGKAMERQSRSVSRLLLRGNGRLPEAHALDLFRRSTVR